MQTTHRIPWQRLAYGYSEVTYAEGEPVDFAKLALEALTMEDSYLASLPERVPVSQGDPGWAPESQDAQRGRQEPRQGGSRPSSGLLCPTHHIGLVETIAKYQEYDDGPNGEKVPAKFFCPGKENGTGQNHSVWRSQAVPA